MILICGCGFLGSWVARFTAQRMFSMHLPGEVILLDDGVIEDRNLHTQFFYPTQLGVSKADALKSVLKNYGIPVVAEERRLTSAYARELVEKYNPTLVIDCFDNYHSRLLTMLAVPGVLHSSLSARGEGRIEWEDQWHLDPDRNMDLGGIQTEEVKIPPCELLEHQEIGVLTALRTSETATRFLTVGEKIGYSLTKDSVVQL